MPIFKETAVMLLVLLARISTGSEVSERHAGMTFTNQTDLVPGLSAHVCIGGIQVDISNDSQLLVSVCTSSSMDISGGIGYLPMENYSYPADIVYGNVSAPAPTPGEYSDGIGVLAEIKRAEHLYQTADGRRILYVEDSSCVREINITTGQVTTIIGIGNCGNGTLDWTPSYPGFSPGLIRGMTYYDEKDMYVFSIIRHGIFVYTQGNSGTITSSAVNPLGDFSGRLLVDRDQLSQNTTDSTRQIVRSGSIIWHKVRRGINYYDLTNVSSSGDLVYQDTFIRYVSSTGNFGPPDTTAVYQYIHPSLYLGLSDAHLTVSPNGRTLLVTDTAEEHLFLVDTSTGDLSGVCSRNSGVTECTFTGVQSSVWLDDFTILAADSAGVAFTTIRLNLSDEYPIVVTPDLDLTGATNLQEDGTWWSVLAIVSGFCGPLLVFWIVVKVVECRRHGIVFDIFHDEDDDIDPIMARNINFLYNKAARGQEYRGKDVVAANCGVTKGSKKRYRPKSKEKAAHSKKAGSPSPRGNVHSAVESLASKFKLPKLKRKKKKMAALDDTDELHPVPQPKQAKPRRKSARPSVDIDVGGSLVSVPMTKTLVGRARPLPGIPSSKTI